MNIWRRGSLTENPYYRMAFRVCRVPREIVRRRKLVQLIGRTRRIVNTDAQFHTIRGEPVTLAEINAAEQILLDPRQRILEEFLVHATERPPLEGVRKLAKEIAKVMAVDETERLPVRDLKGLQPWSQALVLEFLDSRAGPDPSFGAFELELIPPFGRPGEE